MHYTDHQPYNESPYDPFILINELVSNYYLYDSTFSVLEEHNRILYLFKVGVFNFYSYHATKFSNFDRTQKLDGQDTSEYLAILNLESSLSLVLTFDYPYQVTRVAT
jgi:hypothetical protein